MTEYPRLRPLPGGRTDQPQRVPGEPLWREVLGARLRALRQQKGERLTETAGRAGISPQYLSEVERGRKEPSSEMIAALAGALDTTLAGLTREVLEQLWQQAQVPQHGSPTLCAESGGTRIPFHDNDIRMDMRGGGMVLARAA